MLYLGEHHILVTLEQRMGLGMVNGGKFETSAWGLTGCWRWAAHTFQVFNGNDKISSPLLGMVKFKVLHIVWHIMLHTVGEVAYCGLIQYCKLL